MRLFPGLTPDVVDGLQWRVWTGVALSVDKHVEKAQKERDDLDRMIRRRRPRIAGQRR